MRAMISVWCAALCSAAFSLSGADALAQQVPIPKLRPYIADTGLVSITFDVHSVNPLKLGLPLLEKYKIPATIFVTTASVGAPERATWEDINTWVAKKFEIGSRAEADMKFESLGIDAIKTSVATSTAMIGLHTKSFPTVFAAPYGSTHQAMLPAVQRFYKANVKTADADPAKPMNGFNDTSSINPYAISRMMITRDTSPKWVCDNIAWAGKDRRYLVLGFSRVEETPQEGQEGWYQVSKENMDLILDCAASYAKAKMIRLVTVGAALERIPTEGVETVAAP